MLVIDRFSVLQLWLALAHLETYDNARKVRFSWCFINSHFYCSVVLEIVLLSMSVVGVISDFATCA